MAIRTKAEIMEQIKTLVGDDTSDATLEMISDISDTLNDFETKANGDGTDWKKKFEENDAQWRQKYKDRFFSADAGEADDTKNKPNADETKEDNLKTDYEELFK